MATEDINILAEVIEDTTIRLPIIYKRTSTGKVQTWEIEINGNKYRTIAGQLDGKKTISKFTVCAGKNQGQSNETSPAQQALKEATAKRRLKLEAEYRTSMDDIDVLTFKEPLLAHSVTDNWDKVVYPVWVQPKLDGIRCIATREGLFTRNGNPILAAPHILAALAPIFVDYPDIELDGELYNQDYKDNFDDLVSIVRKGKPSLKELDKSAEVLQYWIYDIRDPETNFVKRNEQINDLFMHYHTLNGKCIAVPTYKVDTKAELDMYYQAFLNEGYEGEMIRRDAPYEFNRSLSLLKRKPFVDVDLPILGIIEGKGNRSGGAGKLQFEFEGKAFESNIKGGTKLYEDILANPHNYLGKLATIRYQNLTPKGKPRFPEVIAIRDYE